MDGRALRRGLVMRCPVCGARGIFEGYFTLREACPSCELTFEREDGYWLGAMVVAMALVIAVFAVVFVGGMLLTWPTVPWTGLLIVTATVNVALPIVAYPWCKSVWMGIHHALVPAERRETHRPR